MKAIVAVLGLLFYLTDAFDMHGNNIFQRKHFNNVMGEEIIAPRIVEGQVAQPYRFPYMACLIFTDRAGVSKLCGGMLINPFWILTAGHCIDGKQRATVYLGSVKYRNGPTHYNVTRGNMVLHSAYNETTRNNDIGLIKIPGVKYSRAIAPISFPWVGFNLNIGSIATTMGWGRTSTNGPVSSTLLYTDVRVIPNLQCEKSYGNINALKVCAVIHLGGVTCYGDSGGPLVLRSPNILVGITSFGYDEGCVPGTTDVFTRVTSYLHWIQEKTGIRT